MSKIEWTQETWNPTTGCNKVSRECKFCYAEVMHKRLAGMGQEKYQQPFLKGPVCHDDELEYPLTIKKPTMFFVDSMSDLFHKDIPIEFIAKVFAIMFLSKRHIFQVLTKRADVMHRLFNDGDFYYMVWKYANHFHDKYIKPLEQEMYFEDEVRNEFPLKNVWLGVSCGTQEAVEERVPLLIRTEAVVRFLSCEPLLESIDLKFECNCQDAAIPCGKCNDQNKIHWVIAGGESGNKPGIQPLIPVWAQSLRDQCKRSNIPFFFKQWGQYVTFKQMTPELQRSLRRGEATHKIGQMNYGDLVYHFHKVGKKKSGDLLDGKKHHEFPKQ